MNANQEMPAPFELRPLDLARVSDDEVRALLPLMRALRQEAHPDDDPPTEAGLRGSLLGVNQMSELRVEAVVAWEGADGDRGADRRAIGRAFAYVPVGRDNLHLVQLDVQVAPDRRRRGVGRALLAWGLALARRHDRRLIVGGTGARVPAGDAFARAFGAREVMRASTNELDLEEHGPRELPHFSGRWLA